MFFTGPDRHLYLGSYQYNLCRIMTALAKVVENNGGDVEPGSEGTITNRSLMEKIKEEEDRQDRYMRASESIKDEEKKGKLMNAARDIGMSLDLLRGIKNDPIPVTHTCWIRFVLDDVVYYYSADDNPLFPSHYSKTPVRDGKYSKDAVSEEAKKDWLYDCFYRYDCSQADVVEAANLIFNFLVAAPESEIRRDYDMVAVPNTYNSGTHREKVLRPERMEKLSF